MDVYGYPPYPYNQSDELAKQTFAQQALGSTGPYPNRVLPEPHVMPVPTGAPWNVQGVSWGMPSPPGLVHFTAAGRQALNAQEQRLSPLIHCKRKSLDVEPVIPAKQRITEEKMAAHLSGLHISSDYTSHSLATDDTMDVNMEPYTPPTPSTSSTSSPSSLSAMDKLKGHTIVLSEELKKLQDEPLLPAALIERLEKPRMSLVVWKPRENVLETLIEDEKKNKNEQEEPQRRNGVLVSNHQIIDDVDM